MNEIKTQNGYTVRLKKDFVTVRESQQIQSVFLKNAKLKNFDSADIDLSLTYEAQKKMVDILVVEIVSPKGETVKENLYDYILDMRNEDGQVIIEKLQEIAYGKKNPGNP